MRHTVVTFQRYYLGSEFHARTQKPKFFPVELKERDSILAMDLEQNHLQALLEMLVHEPNRVHVDDLRYSQRSLVMPATA